REGGAAAEAHRRETDKAGGAGKEARRGFRHAQDVERVDHGARQGADDAPSDARALREAAREREGAGHEEPRTARRDRRGRQRAEEVAEGEGHRPDATGDREAGAGATAETASVGPGPAGEGEAGAAAGGGQPLCRDHADGQASDLPGGYVR